ncbi:hypothetical protein Tco_0759871 [Tanacetum coccineum]
MVLNEEWLAGNDEYIERKVLKELKLKRKREEKKSPGRWTRGDEAKDLAEKHKKIKKQQQDTKSSRKIEDKGKERVINVEEDAERKRKIKGKGKEKVVDVEEDAERKRKIKGKGKEKVVDVEEDAERKRKIKVKGKEKVVDFEEESEKNKRINKQKHNSLTYLHYTKFDMLKVKRRLPTFKSWNTSLLKKREIAELQNDYMGIGELQDDVGEGEEPNQKEMLEENIHNILIEKSKIEEKINENLIKFQDDEKLLQLKQRMKDIFKEPDMPEYLSSSSSEPDDDNDDGSQLANENEEKNEEEIIRKGREFSAELRNKAQQQERERKRKGKKEKDQIGSSSQESPVFGIDNSLQGSQPTFDLGASPTYEKMKILSEKKKKMGLKSKYVNKTVDPAVELTEDEKLLGRSIFSTQEEEEEKVFNDDERMILFRIDIQSLAPGLEIDTLVIDNDLYMRHFKKSDHLN